MTDYKHTHTHTRARARTHTHTHTSLQGFADWDEMRSTQEAAANIKHTRETLHADWLHEYDKTTAAQTPTFARKTAAPTSWKDRVLASQDSVASATHAAATEVGAEANSSLATQNSSMGRVALPDAAAVERHGSEGL